MPRGKDSLLIVSRQCFKKVSKKVLGEVLGKDSHKGSEKKACYGFYSDNGF